MRSETGHLMAGFGPEIHGDAGPARDLRCRGHGGPREREAMTINSANPRVQVNPVTSIIGAEIAGVDLREPLDAQTVADIADALVRWKVLFFRDQPITYDQQIAFAEQLRRDHARASDRARPEGEAGDLRRRHPRGEEAVRPRRRATAVRPAAHDGDRLAHRHHVRRESRDGVGAARRGRASVRRRHDVDEPRRRVRRPLARRSATSSTTSKPSTVGTGSPAPRARATTATSRRRRRCTRWCACIP